MIESKYKFPLNKKRDVETLYSQGQMSNFQIDVATALHNAKLEVVQEVMIWNEDYPQNPFRIDIVVVDKDLAIEIDGVAYHNNPKSIERDKRKNIAIKDTGYRRTLRIPIETPKQFAYNPKDETKIRKLKMDGLKSWSKAKIKEIVLQVLAYPDVGKLANSRVLNSLPPS